MDDWREYPPVGYLLSNVSVPTPCSTETYLDLGGMSDIEIVEYPHLNPEVFHHISVDPSRGILLRFLPGCGKTHLANALTGELGDVTSHFRVSAPEIITGVFGELEWRI